MAIKLGELKPCNRDRLYKPQCSELGELKPNERELSRQARAIGAWRTEALRIGIVSSVPKQIPRSHICTCMQIEHVEKTNTQQAKKLTERLLQPQAQSARSLSRLPPLDRR